MTLSSLSSSQLLTEESFLAFLKFRIDLKINDFRLILPATLLDGNSIVHNTFMVNIYTYKLLNKLIVFILVHNTFMVSQFNVFNI
jgi:hypothetical protein